MSFEQTVRAAVEEAYYEHSKYQHTDLKEIIIKTVTAKLDPKNSFNLLKDEDLFPVTY